jgi:hypothetical protein
MPKASMFGVWIRCIGNGITSDTFTPAVSESGTSEVVQLLISGTDCVLFNANYTDQDSRYTRWMSTPSSVLLAGKRFLTMAALIQLNPSI